MKKNSLKTTGIVVASLAAVALVSVGFSAWVIQALTPTEAKSVTLSVADTTDNSIALAVAADPAPDRQPATWCFRCPPGCGAR